MNSKYTVIVLVLIVLPLSIWFFSEKTTNSNPLRLAVSSSLFPVISSQVNHFKESLDGSPKVTSAGSQTVARQITHGLSADIVFLANVRWMNVLRRNDELNEDSIRKHLSNDLVVIATTNDTSITDLSDLKNNSIRVGLGNVTSVPVGVYARKTFQSMGVWKTKSFTPVMFPNVRSVLSAVASGELPGGIVYRSDLRREKSIRSVTTLPDTHVPKIEYPIALTRQAGQKAKRWYNKLISPEATKRYRQYGFDVIRP